MACILRRRIGSVTVTLEAVADTVSDLSWVDASLATDIRRGRVLVYGLVARVWQAGHEIGRAVSYGHLGESVREAVYNGEGAIAAFAAIRDAKDTLSGHARQPYHLH